MNNAIALPRHLVARLTPLAIVLAAACGTSDADAPPAAEAGEAAPADVFADLRESTAKYTDVQVALAEGYVPDPSNMCITAAMEGQPPEAGDMGIHYFRPDLLGITGMEPRVAGNGTHTDFSQPSVLVYEPQADGSMELVAIENLVWAGAWEAANTAPPSFEGHEYVRLEDDPATPDIDEAHGFEPHYELHLWIHRENPNGVATPFNPAVTCSNHQPGGAANHTGH